MQLLITLLFFSFTISSISSLNSPWHYICSDNFCQKRPITSSTDESTVLSLAACRYHCSKDSIIWPKPSTTPKLGPNLLKINPNSIDIINTPTGRNSTPLISAAIKIFKEKINNLAPKKVKVADGGRSVEIHLNILKPDAISMPLDLDESYELNVEESSDGRILATISATNFYGSRHALETLNQLIIYDDLRSEILIPNQITVVDKPAYPYRGILLDTARNYMNVEAIKRTLDGMAASKLNSFHWHITDSHSFPYVSKSLPDLSRLGAYRPEKIYDAEDVEGVVLYGLERGVRVIPEFDAPAHVGEGWQNTDFVACFNKKPWQDFCVEPPCGQLDPTKEKLYDALEQLYGDMVEQFHPDIFHMGGDEVNFNCWNTTENIVTWMKTQGWGQTEADFIKLWDLFQTKALERLERKTGVKLPIVLWTSTLTKNEYLKYLDNKQYIIQIWTTGTDPQIKNLIDNKFRVILSNYDALYLDCGFPGWVTDGHNWCSPYNGWQSIYGNSPAKIVGGDKSLVLGAEATLWTEQVDSAAVDSRLWPRAAAMAEVLWSEPTNKWREAEQRFLVQRERLVQLGIDADGLEPEWCMQYEESCPLDEQENESPIDGGKGMSLSFVLFLAVNLGLILI